MRGTPTIYAHLSVEEAIFYGVLGAIMAIGVLGIVFWWSTLPRRNGGE